ncbi:universal stress protein [Actinoplanes sp. NPDC049265]|uniref:universal stress protein n=1 Tax=Actinoplanes sp. NPDC049265 TaxID=3363902 RepID=UPI00371283EC
MAANKVLVGYDRSTGAAAAARWALDEAERTGASVEFLYAYEWPTWTPAASMMLGTAVWPDNETERVIHDLLETVVTDAHRSHPGVPATARLVQAPAALTLIDRSAGAGLVVLGGQGHSAVAGLLGSVSTAVSTHARCPVVVVRGDPDTGPVVAGVDDTDGATAVLAFAFEAAAGRGGELRVVHACPGSFDWLRGVREPVPEEELSARARLLDDRLAVFGARYPGVKVTADVVPEHPAAALDRASAGARLVVVGSRGRGPVRGALLGSVSRHLLHRCPVSVAVVRTPAST